MKVLAGDECASHDALPDGWDPVGKMFACDGVVVPDEEQCRAIVLIDAPGDVIWHFYRGAWEEWYGKRIPYARCPACGGEMVLTRQYAVDWVDAPPPRQKPRKGGSDS